MFILLLSTWLRNSRSSTTRRRRSRTRDGSRLEALEERIVLSYLGSFRVPGSDGSGRAASHPTRYGYSYGGDVSAVDAEGDELWLSAHVHNLLIGKVSIPNPVAPSHASAFKELPVARATAAAFDITRGLRNAEVQGNDQAMVLGDLDPDGNLVRWVMHDYYNVSQTPYRVLGSYNGNTHTAEGPYGLKYPDGRHVRDQLSGRYISDVPNSWAGMVGGTHVSGGGGLPGQTVIGAGPSLYAYTPPGPSANPLTTRVRATPLLEYPFDDHLPESQRRSLDGWNRASEPMDAVWIGDTVMIAARIGIGEVWYGSSDGPGDLFDPYNPYKGYHAERYEMRLLFYRASDLAGVASGRLNPWDPQPFANVLMPNLMGSKIDSQFEPISMSWDPVRERLYIVQTRVDHSGSRYIRNPVVHVHDLSGKDALKRWAFELTGQRPPLRRLDRLSFASASESDSLAGAKVGNLDLRRHQSLKRLSVEDKATLPKSDPKDTATKTSDADREMSKFWSLEQDQVLTRLNQGTKA